MSLNGNHIGGQCPSNPPTMRDKLIAGGICILIAWLAVFSAFHFDFVPIVKLLASGFAIILTAVIGLPGHPENSVSRAQKAARAVLKEMRK